MSPKLSRPTLVPSVRLLATLVALLVGMACTSASPGASPVNQNMDDQPHQDAYTRVELQSQGPDDLLVTHEVAAIAEGATTYRYDLRWLQARSVEVSAATDLMTGEDLGISTESGVVTITLARPVPPNGQARVRVTLKAGQSSIVTRSGQEMTFTMPNVPPRATVVLPANYELLASNMAAQVLSESDGRIVVSVMHQSPQPVSWTMTARAGITTAPPTPLTNARSWEGPAQRSTERARLSERATQDRDIVYFLQSPETNAFSLYHDYTETRPGVDQYLNVVRTGAQVSDPSAYMLDTGEALTHDVLKGDAITAAGVQVSNVTPDTEVVVIHFPPVEEGHSVRLRISETYTTPESYRLEGTDFVFERSLGRARNSVVLPDGWYLTGSSIPAVIRQTPDGMTRLDFVNGRPEGIDVLLKGRKR